MYLEFNFWRGGGVNAKNANFFLFNPPLEEHVCGALVPHCDLESKNGIKQNGQ